MKPILIIGAGLTGLALAQALKKRSIPYEVYERDPSPDSRAQGYRIRLNQLGLEALHELVPSKVFEQIIREAADWYSGIARLDASTGEQAGPLIDEPPFGAAPPPPPHLHPPVQLDDPFVLKCTATRLPVDRTRYRSALANGIDVSWGKQLDRIESGDEGVVAIFQNGTRSPPGSLLVGCDGYHSRVAELLGLSPQPKLLGGGMIYGKAPFTRELQKEMSPAAQYGIRVCPEPTGGLSGKMSSGNLFIETCRFTDPDAIGDYVFFVLSADDESFAELHGDESTPPKKVAELGIRIAAQGGYHPSLQAILKHQNPELATYRPYLMTMPDDYPSWQSNRHVTLLGDAVHALPPVGGIGGNAGLHDVRKLVGMIESNPPQAGGWDVEEIQAWEAKSREDALIQVKLVHGAAIGSYPLAFWKFKHWEGEELGLPPSSSIPR